MNARQMWCPHCGRTMTPAAYAVHVRDAGDVAKCPDVSCPVLWERRASGYLRRLQDEAIELHARGEWYGS